MTTMSNQRRAQQLPQRQSSIPVPNALLSTVNANRQRQPMCTECEKSLPNQIVFDKIESIIRMMQDEQNGLSVKTAKVFMTKIPSVFTGTDLVQWMMRNLQLEDQQEALHLANLIASHGYIFPIDDHTLSIKNDATFYRFQTPCLWPSNNVDPENTDYAVYLCKRTMQGKTRLELADYEAENLARLQKMFSRKWEFIFMQAESQAKVDKKRDKLERKVLDSQERAFWDVYRPVPGCVNTTELDIKKACRLSKSAKRCIECQKISSAVQGQTSVINQPLATPPAQASTSSQSSTTTSHKQLESRTPTRAGFGANQGEAAASLKKTLSASGTITEQKLAGSSGQQQQQNLGPASPVTIRPTEADSGESKSTSNSSELKSNKSADAEPDRCSAAHASDTKRMLRKQKEEEEEESEVAMKSENISSSTAKKQESVEQALSKKAKDDDHDDDDDNNNDHDHDHVGSEQKVDKNHQADESSSLGTKQQAAAAHSHHHHHHHHPGHSHSHSHHHHPHHHHHHHHHHPHHSHTSAGHQHHHHHHHHHRQCPHHHKQQQQQQQSQGDQAASSSSISRAGSARTKKSSSVRCSTSSLSQRATAPNAGEAPSPGAGLSAGTGSSVGAATNNKSAEGETLAEPEKAAPQPGDRPHSACCASRHHPDPAGEDRQLLLQQPKRPMSATGRKSSLNILRPPSADQALHLAATGSELASLGQQRKGSVHLQASSANRSQLKSTQSVFEPSVSTNSNKQPGAQATIRNSSTQNLQQASAEASLSERQSISDLERELESLKIRMDRGGVKMSKVNQSYLSYFNQWAEYDPFIAQPIPSNPWQSDSTELWDMERQTKDVHCRRVRRWAFSLKELLNDPAGREQFHKFLEKEFSAENLKFWDAVQELKRVHAKDVARRVEAIWTEYLAQDANCPINIDSKSYETSKKNMAKNKSNRYIFDEAAGHVYQLMKNDSYPRYLRSDMYKDYKEASERRRPNQVAFDVFKPQITTLKHKFNF